MTGVYSRDDWQKHYEEDDLRWDLGETAPPFVRWWAGWSGGAGRAVVPGCGQGHEVIFLAARGWEVTAVDFAPGAIQRLSARLKAEGREARLLNQDFFTLDASHDAFYDLLLEQTFFCAIHPGQRPRYVDTARRILKPGGRIVGLFYETGEAGGPPFDTRRADILEHFSGCFNVQVLEKTPHSAERRRGKEWFAVLGKSEIPSSVGGGDTGRPVVPW